MLGVQQAVQCLLEALTVPLVEREDEVPVGEVLADGAQESLRFFAAFASEEQQPVSPLSLAPKVLQPRLQLPVVFQTSSAQTTHLLLGLSLLRVSAQRNFRTQKGTADQHMTLLSPHNQQHHPAPQ